MRNELKDQGIQDLSDDQYKEQYIARRVLNDRVDQIDTSDMVKYADRIEYFRGYGKDDLSYLIGEIGTHYTDRRVTYMRDKLVSTKIRILDLYEVRIDDKLIDLKADAQF